MTKEMPEEDQPLKLEVGETYDKRKGGQVKIVADKREFNHNYPKHWPPFVGYEIGTAADTVFFADGSVMVEHVSGADLIRKHTPPPEVKSLWVVINAEGNSIMRYDAVNAASLAESWDNRGKGPCDIQRIDLTYQGGRRDDLRDKEAGK